MSSNENPSREAFFSGLQLYPEVDLEEPIMASVRQEAEMRTRIRRLRRRGMGFCSFFLLLLGVALYYTWAGTTNAYSSPSFAYGFALLFLLVLFVQLELWWGGRKGVV